MTKLDNKFANAVENEVETKQDVAAVDVVVGPDIAPKI